VFTARYALSPYIKQIRFVFKGLSWVVHEIAWKSRPVSQETIQRLWNQNVHYHHCGRSLNYEKRLLASSGLSVCRFVRLSACLSDRMKQLDCHRADFRDIWYLSIFRKSVEKIQVLLKNDKNNKHFIWRPMYNYDISLNSSWMRNTLHKSCRENQKTHFMFNNIFFREKALCMLDN
jgi:hypothetical protein